MDLLKKIIIGLVFVFFVPSVLIADVLDDELPGDTPAQIKEIARQVIRLGVENRGVVKMTQSMLRSRFTAQQMIKAYEIVGEARKNGLSEEPVMSKLHEGIGKRVQNENIIKAMEKVQERYQTASQYAHQMDSDGKQARLLTGQIAESLAAGVTENHMGRMVRTLTSQKTQNSGDATSLKIQTLMTIKTMARMGASSASVVDVVDNALRNGYDQGKMRQLEKAFVTQARAKYNPTTIAENFSRGMNSGTSVDAMAQKGYINSANAMNGNSFGNGYGAGMGSGQGGAGGAAGGAGSGIGGGSGGMGGGGMGGGGSGQGSGGSGGGGGKGGR